MKRAPEFWHDTHIGWRAGALLPAAMIYAVFAARRMRRKPEWKAPVPVICIGNPTVGGAGKTPVAALIADQLRKLGRDPVILSRGYGAPVKKPVLVDPEHHRAADVGDEPLAHAHYAATVVSPDRVAGGMRAVRVGDAIVMDDGFQNPALAKDLSLLVMDTAYGLGNGLPIPAGPMRMPLGDQLIRANALILIGKGDRAELAERTAEVMGVPVLRAELVPEADVAARLFGQRVVAFAGIGRPEKFFDTLEGLGARLAEARAFADHHPYTPEEAEELMSLARREEAMLVTTEKDMMRLEGGPEPLARLAAESIMLPVRAVPDAESMERLNALIRDVLARYVPSEQP